jgi:hypothetical protein
VYYVRGLVIKRTIAPMDRMKVLLFIIYDLFMIYSDPCANGQVTCGVFGPGVTGQPGVRPAVVPPSISDDGM